MKKQTKLTAIDATATTPAAELVISGHRYRLCREPKNRKGAAPAFHPITINGETFKMCLEYDELAESEGALLREGRDVSLLRWFTGPSLENVRMVFAVSIHNYHPEIDYEAAREIVTIPYALIVAATIAQAFTASLPDVQPAPVEPVADVEPVAEVEQVAGV